MKIAIVKLSAIGDLFQALKSVKALKQSNPQLHISWIVEKKYADAIKLADWIDEVIELDTYFLRKAWFTKKWFQELLRFRNLKFDLIFDLQGNFKSSFITLIIPAKEKVGFDLFSTHEKIAIFPLTKRVAVDLNLPITRQHKKIFDSVTNLAPLHFLKPIFKNDGQGLFCALGAAWENKKLKVDHWVEVIDLLGRTTHEKIYLPFFSNEEEKQVDEIVSKTQHAHKFPKSSLNRLKEAFLHSKGVIGVDSALIHLANLFDVQTYGIFGPSNAKVFGPEFGGKFQVECPLRIEFIKRCPKLRTCPHGACLKKLDAQKLSLEVSEHFIKLVK